MPAVNLDDAIRAIHDEDGSTFLPRYKRVVREAAEAVKQRKGLIFVEGPLGCGKSTLAECLADQLRVTRFMENAEDPEVQRYLSMLYSADNEVRCLGAVGINNRYLSMRMRQYEEALTCAQTAVIDRIVEADEIYMQLFIESGLMTAEQVAEVRRRREAELRILRPVQSRTAPREIVIQITGPAEVFYQRKNRRGRGVEIEEDGKGVSLEYMRRLTEKYDGLPALLQDSGFTGQIIRVGQVIKEEVLFDPASGKHLLPILEFIRDYCK
ncbi:deoxynucleoside kinase [Candidatus Woesearchaeota archaeon]|nr:deoxynucleoside kinase [Candidatus Woesearchaeota archaeon]